MATRSSTNVQTTHRAAHAASAPWSNTGSRAHSGRLPQRTVLVHDYLNQYGGAERVLEVLHDLAPQAPVYTSIHEPARMPTAYRDWDIHTSWMQRIPGVSRQHQRALPAYPLAFAALRVPPCELVLSSSSAFAKAIRPPRGATHVSYIHSPMRFAWTLDDYIAREQLPAALHHALRPLMAIYRARDRATASRANRLIANSTVVRDRIRAWWRRDAVVINPPVEVSRFQPVAPDQVGDAFLMVGRLVPYKRFDLAIEACNALGLPLQIIGDGRDRARLEALAGPNVRFLGHVSDAELAHHYATARATIFMSEDDFGIAQVEAQAAGRPVVALAAGGACDTVVDGETGVHVPHQTTADLVAALQRFEAMTFHTGLLVQHAATFRRERFEQELLAVVDETLDAVRNGVPYAWN